MKAFIKAVEYYLPERVITNDDLLAEFPGLKIDELTRLTGVFERHVCKNEETGADLAVKAAEKLFRVNNTDKSTIDYLIFCTSFSDYITPPTSCILQERLSLGQNIGTYDYNQGCTGFV